MLLVLHNNLAAGGGPTSYVLTTTPESYILTGSSANLVATRYVDTSPGAYSLTGFTANLIYTAASSFLLESTPGSYTLTGSNGNLLYSSVLSATPSSYTITGFDASLEVASPNKVLLVDPGSYVISGAIANMQYSGDTSTIKQGGRGLSPWQLRQNRLEALKKELWYLYQDENDAELKEALLDVVQDDTNLDELLKLLREQLTVVRNLYDKAQQEQYQKAFEAAQEIKKAKVKQRNEEEVAAMLLF